MIDVIKCLKMYRLPIFIRNLFFNYKSPPYGYWMTQKLPQIYTANHATFQIQIRKITVQICGNFWVTQYISWGCALPPSPELEPCNRGSYRLLFKSLHPHLNFNAIQNMVSRTLWAQGYHYTGNFFQRLNGIY